jgi:hypothetical protein
MGILFISCSNDDDSVSNPDNNLTVEEQLIGFWTRDSFEDETGVIDLSECDKQTTAEYTEGGIYNLTVYVDNDDFTGCEVALQTSANWELLSDTELKVFNDQQEIVSDIEIETNNNETFLTITDNFEDGSFDINVFKKVD